MLQCEPVDRQWPSQKCNRCEEKDLKCSENKRARGSLQYLARPQPRGSLQHLARPHPSIEATDCTFTQKLQDLYDVLTSSRIYYLYSVVNYSLGR